MIYKTDRGKIIVMAFIALLFIIGLHKYGVIKNNHKPETIATEAR